MAQENSSGYHDDRIDYPSCPQLNIVIRDIKDPSKTLVIVYIKHTDEDDVEIYTFVDFFYLNTQSPALHFGKYVVKTIFVSPSLGDLQPLTSGNRR